MGINLFGFFLADNEDKGVVDNVANLPDRIEGRSKRYDFPLGFEHIEELYNHPLLNMNYHNIGFIMFHLSTVS